MPAVKNVNRIQTKDRKQGKDSGYLEHMDDIIAMMYDSPQVSQGEYDQIVEEHELDFESDDDDYEDVMDVRIPPVNLMDTGLPRIKGQGKPLAVQGTHDALYAKMADDWPVWFYESTESCDQEDELQDYPGGYNYFWRFSITQEEISAYPRLTGLRFVDILQPNKDNGKYRIIAY